jgi:hypothetical protein
VFDFAPSGLGPRTIQGGSVISDPFSLNQTAVSGAGEPEVATVSNGLDTDFFDAISDPLTAGSYTILLNTLSTDSTATSTPTLVPEPAPLVLVGTGLVALGALRRTRSTSSHRK